MRIICYKMSEVKSDNNIESPLAEVNIETVEHKGDFPTVFDLLAMLVIVVLSQIVVAAVAMLFGMAKPEIFGDVIVDIESFIGSQVTAGQSIAVTYSLSMVVAVFLLSLYIKLRDKKVTLPRATAAGFNPNVILGGLVWLLAAGVVIDPIVSLLPSSSQFVGAGFWAVLTSVFFAPLFEEFIFRGLILESLLRRHRRLISVLISSMLFAIVHFDPAVMVTAFVSGVILGTIYLHTSSIFSVIILHAINNAVAYSIMSLNLTSYGYRDMMPDNVVYFTVYGLSLIICMLGVWLTWRKKKTKIKND